MSSPVELASALQTLVASTYAESGPDANSYETHIAKNAIEALCLKLLRTVQGPKEYTAVLAESCQESAALGLIAALNVADHIADSPTGRLTLTDLCEKTGADRQYLSVALNTVMYHGYFDLVAPDTFANNQFSEVLCDSVKTEASMKDAVGFATDEAAHPALHLLAAATQQTNEGDRRKVAFNYARDTPDTIFQWMSMPGNEWRGQRTGTSMVQFHSFANVGTAADFPWETLPTPIIDIGGGIGSLPQMVLAAPKNQKLNFVIFDIEKTIENAEKVWKAKPQWMQDQVSFISGDFTKLDPTESKIPTSGGTYVIRHVLLDWDDDEVVTIIKNVQNAIRARADPSGPKPKFLIVEMLLTPTSSRFTHMTSVQLLGLSGGITRTEAQFRQLVERAGLTVEKVTAIRGVDLVLEIGLP